MSKRFWLGVLLVLAAGNAFAQTDGFGARRVTLRNGMNVVLAPDTQSTVVDVAVWYRTGSVFERPGQSGISYLLGRLMYRGSRRHSDGEFRRQLMSRGATLNSVTNPDFSCYYETLPAGALDLAFDLEADRMAALAFSPQAFEAERTAVRSDFAARFGASPIARGVQRLYAVAFGAHPYGRPVVGIRDDLDRLTAKDVEAFARDRYAPSQAVLTVVGRFDPKSALATIERTFGAVPKRAAVAAPPAKFPPADGERRDFEKVELPGRVVMVGWRGPSAKDPDAAAVDLIAQVLVRGTDSRMSRLAASQPEILSQAQGDMDASEQASLLYVLAGVAASGDTAVAEQTLVTEVERLGKEPLSAEDLDQAKRQFEIRQLASWQTVRGRAQSLGYSQLFEGDPKAATARLVRIRALNPEDVRLAASRMLIESRRSVVWLSGGAGGQP